MQVALDAADSLSRRSPASSPGAKLHDEELELGQLPREASAFEGLAELRAAVADPARVQAAAAQLSRAAPPAPS